MSIFEYGRRLALVAGVAAVTALAPASGGAQTIDSPYRFLDAGQEASVFVGWLTTGEGEFDLGPTPGPTLGARYGIRLGGPISLEATTTVMPTTRAVIDPAREEGDRKVGEADVVMVSFDARLKFSLVGERTWNNLAPYATAGAGFAFDASGEQPQDTRLGVDDRFEFGTSFLGALGAGVGWVPGGRFAFRGDLDFRLWQLETPRGFRLADRFPDAPQDEWVSGFSFSLGVSYLF